MAYSLADRPWTQSVLREAHAAYILKYEAMNPLPLPGRRIIRKLAALHTRAILRALEGAYDNGRADGERAPRTRGWTRKEHAQAEGTGG